MGGMATISPKDILKAKMIIRKPTTKTVVN